MNQYRIVCFCDSTTYGAQDSEGGWADMLRRHFHRKYLEGGVKAQVYNLGVGGEMSDGLLKRIENEIKARLSDSWIPVIVIGIGSNDTRAKGKPGDYESTPQEYESNLKRILEVTMRYSTKVLLIGLGASSERLKFKDLYYSNERFKIFDDINTGLANEYNIPKVKINTNLIVDPKFEELFHDMVHPNSEGHKWLFKQILPHIEKLLN